MSRRWLAVGGSLAAEFSVGELSCVSNRTVSNAEARPVVAVDEMVVIRHQNRSVRATRPFHQQAVRASGQFKGSVGPVEVRSEAVAAHDVRNLVVVQGRGLQLQVLILSAG